VEIGVLGPLEVLGDDGLPQRVGSPTQRRLLTVLASRPSHVFGTEVLIDALWGEEPPQSAVRSLRTYVSRLRSSLAGAGGEEAIETVSDGYRLSVSVQSIDIGRFEQLLRDASVRGSDAVSKLTEALALWRGTPLADAADLPAVEGEVRRLEELRGATRTRLAEALLGAGHWDEAVAHTESLVAEEPLREGAWTVLVRSLARAGRSAEALRAFQRAADALDEAGLVPSSALKAAEQEALAVPSPGAAQEVSPEADHITAPPRAGLPLLWTADLPVATDLVGREADLATALELIQRARVVTVLGPGGVGKTSLAVEVARRLGHDLADGCRFVALAAVEPGEDARTSIVDALGFSVDANGVENALAAAAALDSLVVLDNCEHVLDDVAEAVERMLTGQGPVRILATSRERIGVAGEHALALRPLETTGANASARQLFMDRANAADPELALSPETMDEAELATLDEILARLDGLPLAIEMAASRLASTGLEDLLDLLDDQLSLRAPRRRVEPRHRTMSAVIEWSTSLLEDEERAALTEMAVFSGPVGRDDIEAVVDRRTYLELVPALAERSLLFVERGDGAVRYGMLDTVRQQVRTSSPCDPGTSARHAAHFARRLAEVDAAMRTVDEPVAVVELADFFPELSGAIRWSLAHETSMAVSMLGHLHLAARNQLRGQPFAWAQEALGSLDAQEAGLGEVISCVVERHVRHGELQQAEELARRAASLEPVSPMTLELLADVLGYRGRHQEAIAVAQRQLELSERLGDHHGHQMATVNIVLSRLYSGDVSAARAGLPDIPAATEAAPSVRGWLEYITGEVALADDPGSAETHLRAAIEAADSVDNRFLGGVARVSVASLVAHSGPADDAIVTLRSIVDYWRRHGARTQMATTLRHLVILLVRIGAFETAAVLLGAVQPDSVRPSSGDEARRLDEASSKLEEELGSDRLSSLIAQGGRMSLDEASSLALRTLSDR
jgi:predicted ATPase/DNA-binding SARP family transcriptional activator